MIRKHLTLDIRNEEVVLDDTKSLKQYLNENEQLENSPNYSRGTIDKIKTNFCEVISIFIRMFRRQHPRIFSKS